MKLPLIGWTKGSSEVRGVVMFFDRHNAANRSCGVTVASGCAVRFQRVVVVRKVGQELSEVGNTAERWALQSLSDSWG